MLRIPMILCFVSAEGKDSREDWSEREFVVVLGEVPVAWKS